MKGFCRKKSEHDNLSTQELISTDDINVHIDEHLSDTEIEVITNTKVEETSTKVEGAISTQQHINNNDKIRYINKKNVSVQQKQSLNTTVGPTHQKKQTLLELAKEFNYTENLIFITWSCIIQYMKQAYFIKVISWSVVYLLEFCVYK